MTTTTNTTKTNKFATKCNTCRTPLDAGEGVLVGRMVGGSRQWLYRCIEGCRPVRNAETHRCEWHGPSDDECNGNCSNQSARRPMYPSRSARMIAMEAEAKRELAPIYWPYLDTVTEWGDASEMAMHAMDAWHDRNES